MAAPLPRWILGVTTTTLVALAAGPAAAEGGRRSFTVSATVVRAASVRVAARPEAGGIRIDARVDGRGAAGVAVAGAGDTRATRAAAAPLSADIADRPGTVVVTVLPDGQPTSIRVRE